MKVMTSAQLLPQINLPHSAQDILTNALRFLKYECNRTLFKKGIFYEQKH